MTLTDVQIVDLPAMRVASALGFGPHPEDQAWKIMLEFAADAGIDLTTEGVRTFGFNNPNPSPGSENYGYEIWLPIGPEIEARAPLEIKEVPAGRYAVARFTGLSNIGRTWQELVAWFEDGPYTAPPTYQQCLEALLNPLEPDPEEYRFELYLPIAS